MAKPWSMIRILVAFCISTFFTVTAAGQSVQEIVARYFEALGGKEKLQSLHSVYQEGTVVLPNGTEMTLKSWRVYDRLYRQEVDCGTAKIVVIVTPRQGWISGPHTGGVFKPLPEVQLKALQTQLDPAGALADYNAKGSKVERAGLDTVEGRPCYLVRVWFPSNQSITYSIDEKTWHILRETRKCGEIVGDVGTCVGWRWAPDDIIDIRFGEYRDTRGGYVFPFAMRIEGLGRVDIRKIEVNGNVDADALSKPRSK